MSSTTMELRSLITSDGELRLTLEEVPVAAPGPDDVVLRVEAAPINLSDLAVLLGPADVAPLSIDRSSRWAWFRRSALRGRAAARQSTSETGSA